MSNNNRTVADFLLKCVEVYVLCQNQAKMKKEHG